MQSKWQQFKNYIKQEGQELILAMIVLILVVLGFGAYLKWVGLPMTRAKNNYNDGMILAAAGDKQDAHAKFVASLQYWDTPEAEKMEAATR